MASLTDVAEGRTLAWLIGEDDPAPVPPVLPLMAALTTTESTDSTPGTEVTGGGYERQEITLLRSGSTAANTVTIRWEGLPVPTTVASVEIWDSAETPVRWWYHTLDEPKEVTDGVLEIAVGDLTLTVD